VGRKVEESSTTGASSKKPGFYFGGEIYQGDYVTRRTEGHTKGTEGTALAKKKKSRKGD